MSDSDLEDGWGGRHSITLLRARVAQHQNNDAMTTQACKGNSTASQATSTDQCRSIPRSWRIRLDLSLYPASLYSTLFLPFRLMAYIARSAMAIMASVGKAEVNVTAPALTVAAE
jgi:hypothetical protein